MKKDQHATSTSRREFLRGTVITGTAAAVVTALPQAAVAGAADEPQQQDKKCGSKGYHVTRHVMDYYRTARS